MVVNLASYMYEKFDLHQWTPFSVRKGVCSKLMYSIFLFQLCLFSVVPAY